MSGEGKWLWLVAPHVAGRGMANAVGAEVQSSGKSEGTNSRLAAARARSAPGPGHPGSPYPQTRVREGSQLTPGTKPGRRACPHPKAIGATLQHLHTPRPKAHLWQGAFPPQSPPPPQPQEDGAHPTPYPDTQTSFPYILHVPAPSPLAPLPTLALAHTCLLELPGRYSLQASAPNLSLLASALVHTHPGAPPVKSWVLG